MKPALCISKSRVVTNEKVHLLSEIDFDTLDYHIRDRAECETNFDYLQIIPYITLRRKSDQHIFVYQRGVQSGESRLMGKCSIGLGGHIDNELIGFPYQHFTTEAIRELEEEVGLNLNDEDRKQLLLKFMSHDFNLIYINVDDVSKVHLGLSIIFDVDDDMLNHHEEGIIDKGQFLSLDEIKKLHFNNDITLEMWSIKTIFDFKLN